MPSTQKMFQNFCKIPFSNRSSFRITKRSGKQRMASQLRGCGFLGTRVEAKKKFVRSSECVTHGRARVHPSQIPGSLLYYYIFKGLLDHLQPLGYSEGRCMKYFQWGLNKLSMLKFPTETNWTAGHLDWGETVPLSQQHWQHQ